MRKTDGCNLDRTGMRLVKKGVSARLFGSLGNFYPVIKVSRGLCWIRSPGGDQMFPCCEVLVAP